MRHNFFLYVLVKEDLSCFKVGISKTLISRIRNLINFGPFNYEKTILIPSNTEVKMRKLEDDIKETFKKFNFQIRKLKSSNGETEWYHIDCLRELTSYLENKLSTTISADIKIINHTSWDQKITDLLLRKRNKQSIYTEQIKKAISQYKDSKLKNFDEFTNLINTLIPMEILYIESLKYDNGYEYKLLCNKNGFEKHFLGSPVFISNDENIFYSSLLCTSSKEDDNFICYKINLSGKHIYKNWTCKDFCKELEDYFYSRGYKKQIKSEYKNLLSFDIDYINSKVKLTGNKLIDDYIFDVFGDKNRFLPQYMDIDFLKIIIKDLEDFLYMEKDLKEYIFVIYSSLMLQKDYDDGVDVLNNFSIKFTSEEFFTFLQKYSISLTFELLKRKKILDEYPLLSYDNIFKDNYEEDIKLKVNKDFIIDNCIN